MVRRLVADGAAVVLHSWSPHDTEQPWGADPGGPHALLAELRVHGGRVEHVCADLADPNTPARLVDAARHAFGHLDVVVANHARSSAQALAMPTELPYIASKGALHQLTPSLAAHLMPRAITVNWRRRLVHALKSQELSSVNDAHPHSWGRLCRTCRLVHSCGYTGFSGG